MAELADCLQLISVQEHDLYPACALDEIPCSPQSDFSQRLKSSDIPVKFTISASGPGKLYAGPDGCPNSLTAFLRLYAEAGSGKYHDKA